MAYASRKRIFDKKTKNKKIMQTRLSNRHDILKFACYVFYVEKYLFYLNGYMPYKVFAHCTWYFGTDKSLWVTNFGAEMTPALEKIFQKRSTQKVLGGLDFMVCQLYADFFHSRVILPSVLGIKREQPLKTCNTIGESALCQKIS